MPEKAIDLNERGWHPRPATAKDVPAGTPFEKLVVYERHDGLTTPAMPHAEAARNAALKLEEAGAEPEDSAAAPPVPELPEDLKAAGWQIFRDRGEDGLSEVWLFQCVKGERGRGQKKTNRWHDPDVVIKGALDIQRTEDKHSPQRRPFVEPEVTEVPAVTDEQRRAILAALEREQGARWPRLRRLEGLQDSSAPLTHAEKGELHQLGQAYESAYERAVEALGGDADAVQEVRDRVEASDPAAEDEATHNVLESAVGDGAEEEVTVTVEAAPAAEPAPASGDTLFPAARLPGDFSPGASAVRVPQMRPERISTHPSTLMRAGGLDPEHVADLRAVLKSGGTLPAVDVYFDGTFHWLADGNHRHQAAHLEDALLDVNVHKGTLRDAILHAVRANAGHGLKRSNDDKRLAVVTLLADPEWSRESDTSVAGLADVTQPFVGKVQGWLEKLLPLLAERAATLGEDEAGELSDWDYADQSGVPEGLVAVVRGLDVPARAALTHNVMSRAETRKGRDGRQYSVEKPAAEEVASLFAEEPPGDDTRGPAAAGQPGPSSEREDGESPAAARAETSGAPAEAVATEMTPAATAPPSRDAEPLPSTHRLAEYLKARPDGAHESELTTAGFGFPEIAEARRARVIERHENGKCYYAWKPADVAEAVRGHGGRMTRLALEELGCQSYALTAAVGDGAVAQPEPGVFTLPEANPPAAAAGDSRDANNVRGEILRNRETPPPDAPGAREERRPEQPSVESLLKGRPLTVAITWIPGLTGSVNVTVNVAGDAQGASRTKVAEKDLHLSPALLSLIHAQVEAADSKAAAAKRVERPQQKPAAAKKAASKAGAAKKTAGRASKSPAKKAASKGKAAGAAGGGAKKNGSKTASR